MPATRAHILAVTVFICAAILPAGRSVAGGQPPDIASAADRAPGDTDLLLVIDHAADHRRGAAGGALAFLADKLFADGDTFRKWDELARTLGWSDEQAFDQLLGRRIVLVGRGLGGADPSFALLADVDRAAEWTLRKRLKLAPRGIVNGRTLYSVEDGRFELTVERTDGGATVLVAPANRPKFFDEMAAMLGGRQPGALSDTPEMQQLRALVRAGRGGEAPPTPPDMLLFFRTQDNAGGWAGLSAWLDGPTLRATIVASAQCEGPVVTPWSLATWKALAEGSLACVVERRPRPGEAASTPLLDDVPWLAPDEALDRDLGERHAVVLRRDPAGGLSVTGAIELHDLAAGAVVGDALINHVLIALAGKLGVGAWNYDFHGLAPDSTRVVHLAGPDGESMPFIGGPGFSLFWSYRPEGDGRSWLIGSTNRTDFERAARALADCADGPAGRDMAPWLTVGRIEPAALHAALTATGRWTPPILDCLNAIDAVQWRVRKAEAGLVRGEATIALRPPP